MIDRVQEAGEERLRKAPHRSPLPIGSLGVIEVCAVAEIEIQALPGLEVEASEYDEQQLKAAVARRLFESQGGGDFPAMDKYWDLIARGWQWRQAVYILWLSMPEGRRIPGTQNELATAILGLTSDRQLRAWRDANPGIQVEVGNIVRERVLWAIPGVFEALIKSASSPGGRHSGSDRRLFFEMTGFDLRNGRRDLPEDMSGLSEAELIEIAAGGNSE